MVIEPGVFILGAEHVFLGDNVWLDRATVLIAGPPRDAARIVSGIASDARLTIGRDSHVGIGSVIQAHGGVKIGDCFTASSGVRIYSFSNDPSECHAGTTEFGHNNPGYRITPVEIGRNVWLGLDVLVLGGTIGDDAFVKPKSVVLGDIPAGQVAAGTPAVPLRARFEKAEV